MSSPRPHPLLVATLAVCGVLAAGEAWWIYERFAAGREAAAKVAQKRSDLAAMAELVPAPVREVAGEIEADLARAQRAVAAMETDLKGRGPAAERLQQAKPPAARTDAYFDLATFVERMRELARKHSVDVRPEAARFGFATYTNEAPEFERIESVFQQRQVMQHVLEALLESQPRTLLAVKRELPPTKRERAERHAALAAVARGEAAPESTVVVPVEEAEGPDLFTIDPRMSVRAPGFLDASALRVTFVGQTQALRGFLNRLAGFELPVLVREVEVEPVSGDEVASETTADLTPEAAPPASIVLSVAPAAATAQARAASRPSTGARVGADGLAPIVSRPFSKFTVTVEFIELVTPPPAAAEAAPAEPAPAAKSAE